MTVGKVFCVIGDLSFFYDQNALWNQNLRGNFRILLLNNGRGGIFNQLPGLSRVLPATVSSLPPILPVPRASVARTASSI